MWECWRLSKTESSARARAHFWRTWSTRLSASAFPHRRYHRSNPDARPTQLVQWLFQIIKLFITIVSLRLSMYCILTKELAMFSRTLHLHSKDHLCISLRKSSGTSLLWSRIFAILENDISGYCMMMQLDRWNKLAEKVKRGSWNVTLFRTFTKWQNQSTCEETPCSPPQLH